MIRSKLVVLVLLSAAAPLAAQAGGSPPPAATPRGIASSSEIAAMILKAENTIRPDQPNLVQPLLNFAPYRASLEYRQAGAAAAVHRDDAEFFYVVKGGGNLIEGGTLVDPAPGDGRNTSAKAITGGASRHVAAGDTFVVARGVPHQFDKVDGALVLITMKLPMPGAP